MIVYATFNARRSQWHERLDGKLIDPGHCICLDNAHPELRCPIDDHVIRWLENNRDTT